MSFALQLDDLVRDAYERALTGRISFDSYDKKFKVLINQAPSSYERPRTYRAGKDLAQALGRAHENQIGLYAGTGTPLFADPEQRAELLSQLFSTPFGSKYGGHIRYLFNFADRCLFPPFMVTHYFTHFNSFNEIEAFTQVLNNAGKPTGLGAPH